MLEYIDNIIINTKSLQCFTSRKFYMKSIIDSYFFQGLSFNNMLKLEKKLTYFLHKWFIKNTWFEP